jgi:hypothetical protein
MPMTTALDATGARVQRKITRRLIPFLFLLYITAYLDRVNVSFAGLGIPRAMLAESWSARKWIASIMMAWGLPAELTGLIHTATESDTPRRARGLMGWTASKELAIGFGRRAEARLLIAAQNGPLVPRRSWRYARTPPPTQARVSYRRSSAAGARRSEPQVALPATRQQLLNRVCGAHSPSA